MIPFNKPFLSGKELDYIREAVNSGKISGNGIFSKKCQDFFRRRYEFKKALLTTSCTDALEMSAILLDIKTDDEIIIPSYTFVSTANAFVLRGAKIVFADSMVTNPNIDADKIESLITANTKAIVVVHYAGIACDMGKIMRLAEKYSLYVIEDAAQAIDSYYLDENSNKKALGSIGHLAAFSFHETKNIISGEGGMLVINDKSFEERAEIIWEKGTNRSAFFRGEIDKYGWVDIGSSFLPSEIIAAFLYAQLQNIKNIQAKRLKIWHQYWESLRCLTEKKIIQLPYIPDYATNNGHMFYVVCQDLHQRDLLINYLKAHDICAVFHYQSLHKSPYYRLRHDHRDLKNSDFYSDSLLRLPMFYDLQPEDVNRITNCISIFFSTNG